MMNPGSTAPFTKAEIDRMVGGLIVDSFAGGGGASTGIEWALGRSPDYAINHDSEALCMHEANHPQTVHLTHNIWKLHPMSVTKGQPVGALWASPDCRSHSRASGGRPRKQNIRDLAWVIVHWAKVVRPKLILLENVSEFADWGPLTQDGQPCENRKGQTFAEWVSKLERLGYRVEYRMLRACDYGAPTIRQRLFLVARCDDKPIIWPEPTHAAPDDLQVISGILKPFRTAASIIDWSIACPTIFMSRADAVRYRSETGTLVKRPLEPSTLARIAKGVRRRIIDARTPFIIPNNRDDGQHSSAAILRQFGQSVGSSILDPIGTTTCGGGGKSALVTTQLAGRAKGVFVAQQNTGMDSRDARLPLSTILAKGANQTPIAVELTGPSPAARNAPHILNMKGSTQRTCSADSPMPTQCAQGNHIGVVNTVLDGPVDINTFDLTPTQLAAAKRVAAFLREHGCWDGPDIVIAHGYVLTDIGLRMLTPRELARGQGFADSYTLDPEHAGQVLTKTSQTRMIGNSVCPHVAYSLARANVILASISTKRPTLYRPWGAAMRDQINSRSIKIPVKIIKSNPNKYAPVRKAA